MRVARKYKTSAGKNSHGDTVHGRHGDGKSSGLAIPYAVRNKKISIPRHRLPINFHEEKPLQVKMRHPSPNLDNNLHSEIHRTRPHEPHVKAGNHKPQPT